MHLLLVGLSHRTAPVELRERRRLPGARRGGAAGAGGARLDREAVVLSTCNRAEVYAACEEVDAARADLSAFMSRVPRRRSAALAPHVYDLLDLDAARHLLRVAAGLDSLVVGEPQILGQVKEAHTAGHRRADGRARAQPAVPLVVRRRQARAHRNRAGSGAVSVSFAAVSLARKIFGDLKGRSVLVVGAGEMGKLTAQHMKSQGVQRVTIVSRTMAHAARTAEAIGGAQRGAVGRDGRRRSAPATS